MSIEGAPTKRRVAVFLAGCVALSVAVQVLAWPRLGASLIALPTRDAAQDILDEKKVPNDAVTSIIDRRNRALGVVDDADGYEAVSTALMYQAQDGGDDAAKKKELAGALVATEEALKRSPSSPWLWFRAAAIRYRLFGARPEVIKDLLLSLQTGRYEPEMLAPRLALMMKVRAIGGDELEAQIPQQIRFVWETAPAALVKAANEGGFAGAVSDALASDPEQLGKWKRFSGALSVK